MGHSQSNSKREVYNDIRLPQETRKTFGQTHQENKGEGPNKIINERKVKNDTTEINKDHKRLLPLIVFQGNRQTREMNKFLKSVSLPIRARK